jgi:hypothetical protein
VQPTATTKLSTMLATWCYTRSPTPPTCADHMPDPWSELYSFSAIRTIRLASTALYTCSPRLYLASSPAPAKSSTPPYLQQDSTPPLYELHSQTWGTHNPQQLSRATTPQLLPFTDSIKQKRPKAVDMRFHWIRDRVRQAQFTITCIPTQQNLADYFTKNLPFEAHQQFHQFLVSKATTAYEHQATL